MNSTANTNRWLFVAAAKGLQKYILRSDPLKEMIGASELIESLPRARLPNSGFLAKVLPHLDFAGGYNVLTDASGAARILFDSKEAAETLARVWPELARHFAPGMEMAVSVVKVQPGQLGAAIRESERELTVNRNKPAPALPEAGPWVARNRRTGLPAAQRVTPLASEERDLGKEEPVDNESTRKREAARWTSGDTLLSKVVPGNHRFLVSENLGERQKRWPSDLTRLAAGDNGYVAIIHADANGLGLAMMSCIEQLEGRNDAEGIYKNLCAAIEKASVHAAQAAMRRVIEATLAAEESLGSERERQILPIPVRPIVCAGEDFTCIIRAAHAIQFAEDYVSALERETKERFKELTAVRNLEALTACAGVVFCKSHFPFSRAYGLAENLCKFAKKQTHRQASAIAFLRLKSSLQPSDDYEAVVNHAFELDSVTGRVVLTMNPYVAGSRRVDGLPALGNLRTLMNALEHKAAPRSALRELVSRAYESKAAADQAFDRLRLIMKESAHEAWAGVAPALESITGNGLWKAIPGQPDSWCTPLYDALELLNVERPSA